MDARVKDGSVRRGYYFDELAVGMSASRDRTITDEDVRLFAALTGDDNPVHLDEAFASGTVFGGRIAHGILTASLFSAVIGARLPGPGSIYISQSLNFRAPVKIGDEVVATARVTELIEARDRAILACACTVNDKTVLDGEAVILVPRRSEQSEQTE